MLFFYCCFCWFCGDDVVIDDCDLVVIAVFDTVVVFIVVVVVVVVVLVLVVLVNINPEEK